MSINKKKSIIEEALLERDQIFEAAKNNAKELLLKQLEPKINQMVKESFENDEESEVEDDAETVVDTDLTDAGSEDETSDLDTADSDLDLDDDSDLDEPAIGGDESGDLGEPTGDIEGGLDLDLDKGSDLGLGDDLGDSDDEVIDLTDKSDDEVISVFKKMKSTDTVQVVKTSDGITLKDGEEEYVIKLDEQFASDENEIIYEVTLSDDIVTENAKVERTQGSQPTKKSKGFDDYVKSRLNESKNVILKEQADKKAELLSEQVTELSTAKENLITENNSLKSDLNKHKDVLRELRESVQQLALFNNKLTYSVKLITENATTKDEKMNIIDRFDAVASITESESLYKTIIKEFKSKATITESINEKIDSIVSTDITTKEGSLLKESVEDPMKARFNKLISYKGKK